MERKQILLLVGALILTTLLVSSVAVAQGLEPESPQGPTEALTTGFTYQGQLNENGSPVNDTCDMRFKLYDDASVGAQVGGEINATVPITDGLFTVGLNEGGEFGSNGFTGERRWLGVEVKCMGESVYTDMGRQELTAVPYALYALDTQNYAQVVVVAKSGGDYTSVQAAIDSITDAAAGKPYLVWVAPGVYNETVVMKPYVHLQGAGQEATTINSTTTNSTFPPTQATLVLARNTSLRDLTVGNAGTDSRNVALLATDSTTETLVADVTAQAQGAGTSYYAIFFPGGGMGIALQDVTALSENGSGNNFGLYISNGTAATLGGGSFTGRGGTRGYGIYTRGSSTTLDAEGVTALGENGTTENFGLYNYDWTATTLRGGSFTARGAGSTTRGIYNYNHAWLEAESVTALAEDGSDNHGLDNYSQAIATLYGSSFTARGGSNNRGIYNRATGATLQATSVTALAENGSSDNRGLMNESNATATLYGGSFTGYKATSGGSVYGLFNTSGADATLQGGSFTASGSNNAYGISNMQNGSTLEIERITAVGENGSSGNYGLYNGFNDTATTNASSSQFIGSDDGLLQGGGTVRLGVSQLDGQATCTAGTLTCFQVYDGGYNDYPCPSCP
jgi:hypothetical protein